MAMLEEKSAALNERTGMGVQDESGKKSIWQQIFGWLLVVLGLCGLILPIIPGIPLLAAGLAILSTQNPWVRSWLIRTKRRMGTWWPRRLRLPRRIRTRTSRDQRE